jgi:anti-anti-sigma regulatory factor
VNAVRHQAWPKRDYSMSSLNAPRALSLPYAGISGEAGATWRLEARMSLLSVFLDGEVLLTVDGVLDGGVAPAYHHLIEQALEQEARRVVVDLTRTTAVDGGGSAVLAATAAACVAQDTHLIIALPNGVEAEITDPGQVRVLLRSVDPWQDAG